MLLLELGLGIGQVRLDILVLVPFGNPGGRPGNVKQNIPEVR